VSRDDESDKDKEVVHLRLRLHHVEMQLERTSQTTQYFSIEARDFEAKWLRVLEDTDALRKELQATREDLDRANEVLAKLFRKNA
jgi:hypothetical protein